MAELQKTTPPEEMRDLIKKELEFNGIQLHKCEWLAADAVIDEITRMIVPEIHEGRTAPCGVVFADDQSDFSKIRTIFMGDSELALARRLANGIDSFLIYEKETFRGLAFYSEPQTTELQLVRNFPSSGGLIVQRNASGVTKFYQSHGITLHESRNWFTKPLVKEASWKISQCVSGMDRLVLERILEFAFHLLSPASHLGATLVWFLQPPTQEELVELPSLQDLTPFRLSLLSEKDSSAVCHLLSQIDGATILDPAGNLIRTGVHLNYSARSAELISELKGTRHTSARRFSYDVGHTLVIAVSEDGPVTVFSDGASIANLRIQTSHKEARLLKDAVPEKKEDISSNSFEVLCGKCSKTAMIEKVTVKGWIQTHTVNCPICGTRLHTAECFSLECRPFKRVATATEKRSN